MLALERGDILVAYVDKSDTFARTLVDHGTFGFIPGQPSAYTQPLYGHFLSVVYWLLGREWWSAGGAQVLVAVATACVVLAIGRRFLSPAAGLAGALLTTLHPYLVWHDVHLNREILDQLVAAVVVLLTLHALERLDLLRAGALGVALGVSILGNARLALLPIVILALLARRHRPRQLVGPAAALVAACAITLLPWVARNASVVGCVAITTDSRALWKANNANTYDVLARGDWIDQVPLPPGAPPSPQVAGAIYEQTGRIVPVDECEQLDTYQELVLEFWRDHPGEKARLAGQAVGFLWQPSVMRTEGRSEPGGTVDSLRDWVEPLYMIPVYALALAGLALVPRRFAIVAITMLGYQTVVAMIFAGTTRYRIPWDFLLMLLAGATLARLLERRRRGTAST